MQTGEGIYHPPKSKRLHSTVSILQNHDSDHIEKAISSPVPAQRSRSRSMVHHQHEPYTSLHTSTPTKPSSRSFPPGSFDHVNYSSIFLPDFSTNDEYDDDGDNDHDDENGHTEHSHINGGEHTSILRSSSQSSKSAKTRTKPRWRSFCEMLLKFLCLGAVVFFLYTNIKVVKYSIIKVLYFIQTIDPLLGSILLSVSMVIQALLLLPCLPFTLAAGYMYGIWYGTVVVQLASTASAIIGFLVSRYLLYAYIRRRFLSPSPVVALGHDHPPSSSHHSDTTTPPVAHHGGDSITAAAPSPTASPHHSPSNIWIAIDRAIADDSFKITFLLRFSPLHPFGVFNYLFGITSISTYHYIVATFFAIFPTTILEVYLGTALRSFSSIFGGATGAVSNPRDRVSGAIKPADYSSPEKIMLYCGVVVSLFVTAYLTMYIKAKLEEQLLPYQNPITHTDTTGATARLPDGPPCEGDCNDQEAMLITQQSGSNPRHTLHSAMMKRGAPDNDYDGGYDGGYDTYHIHDSHHQHQHQHQPHLLSSTNHSHPFRYGGADVLYNNSMMAHSDPDTTETTKYPPHPPHPPHHHHHQQQQPHQTVIINNPIIHINNYLTPQLPHASFALPHHTDTQMPYHQHTPQLQHIPHPQHAQCTSQQLPPVLAAPATHHPISTPTVEIIEESTQTLVTPPSTPPTLSPAASDRIMTR